MNPISSNIISENEFRNRISEIFNEVSDAVSRTLGPYGKTTIIEKFGEMHVTKDGWTVLKNIHYDNNTDNNILYLLTKIASQVVVKVGDGSTSSIIATKEILKLFNEHEKELLSIDFGPRDLTYTMEKLIKILVQKIEADRTVIDTDTFNEEKDHTIYSLAMISTNGNETISKIISTIYSVTKNPSISFIKGNYADHTYDIVEGYKLDIRLLDGIYITSESGDRTALNPIVLMFDHRFDIDHYTNIIIPFRNYLNQAGITQEVYVVAPYYAEAALQRIKADTNLLFKASGGKFNEIYCRASITSNHSRQLYSDLSVLLGATVIDTVAIEESLKLDEQVRGSYIWVNYKGRCDKLTINLKDAVFSGFSNADEALFKVTVADAKSRFQEAQDRFSRMDVVSPELINLKERVSKLRCRMGIISVGGVSTLEQAANYDLVDDAVKACESAYMYGYNIGCSLVIPLTIKKLMREEKDPDTDNRFTEKEHLILKILHDAFLNVYRTIIRNKYESTTKGVEEQVEKIINMSLNYELPYNLVNNTVSEAIINPCRTDTEILKGAGSMVSLLMTSNQYIQIKLPNQH